MPTPPSQPPGARHGEPTPKRRAQPPGPPPKPGTQRPAPPEPGTQHPAPLPEPGPRKTTRQACPRETGRPLPDPAAVRLCAVPDSAPPYDDEALPRTLSAETAHAASADAGSQTSDSRLASHSGQTSDGGRGHQHPRPGSAGPDPVGPGGGNRDREAPGWPSLFAQVLAETLAGSRPPGQIVPWTTQRARSNIQRLGPTLTAGQPTGGPRPLVRRVVTSRPSSDVLEMTVVVRFGPRIRALAVRLELATPRRAAPGDAVQAARWLCTDVEAA